MFLPVPMSIKLIGVPLLLAVAAIWLTLGTQVWVHSRGQSGSAAPKMER
ncbi:hypothetical protein ACOQFR_08630 [Arenimonas sp. MALMAid1274]